MKSELASTIGAVLTLVVGLVLRTPLAAQAHHHHYKLIDMGPFGGPNSSSLSLNTSGVTAGWSATAVHKVSSSNRLVSGGVDGIGSVVTVAFQWKNGLLTNLGALPGRGNCSEPFSVSSQGEVVGTSENGRIDPITGVKMTRAVMWKNGRIVELGSLGGNQNLALWINGSRQVVGWSSNNVRDPFSMIDSLFFDTENGTQTRAFLWEKGKIKDLGTLGGDDAAASFINESGQVAGTSYTSSTPNPTTGRPPADEGIYFTPNSPPFAVQFLSFATGKEVTVAPMPREPGWGFSVSSDGRWLLYCRLDAVRADLMLVENFR